MRTLIVPLWQPGFTQEFTVSSARLPQAIAQAKLGAQAAGYSEGDFHWDGARFAEQPARLFDPARDDTRVQALDAWEASEAPGGPEA